MNKPSLQQHPLFAAILGKNSAFTLVELLVTIAIVGLLMSMLAPALKNAKEKARQIACMNNLRQIGTAALNYAGDYNGWLPHANSSHLPSSNSNQTWKYLIAPYVNISSPTNSLLERGVFHCPSQNNASCGNSAFGDNGFYGGYGWNFTYLGYKDAVSGGVEPWVNCSQIGNPSQVIMAGDTSDWYLNNASCYNLFFLYSTGFAALESYRHTGGGNYLWVDGHVSWHLMREVFNNKDKWYPLQ
ncbi:MAG: DUF1559 domain-containing protein [Verrucomicrobiae bacterium]|nr:DUF1559 domain-containing protein [Verrucomicrobiae bacterium]